MPIPYMGSKNKSCVQICNTIENFTKGSEKFVVELFCGGFAIGEEFLSRKYKVIANDKNKYVIALLDQVVNKKLDEKKCLERVSREKFNDVIKNPSKYEEWYVGYIQCIWSFGNNQKSYLFGEENEIAKHSLFQLVVHKEVDDFVRKIMPKKYIEGILKQDDRYKSRIALGKVLRAMGGFERLQSLQSLESLERLERLNKLGSVTFISMSYEEVEIPNNAIVYCDPPYKGTATYAEGGFNHDKFRDYIRKLSKTNKVFVSEYTAPNDFKCIYEFSQKSGLAGRGLQSHNNQPNEKLFIYNK